MPLSRRALLAASALAPFAAAPAFAAGDRIRKIVIVAAAQASDPQEYRRPSSSLPRGASWGSRSRCAACRGSSSRTWSGTTATSGT